MATSNDKQPELFARASSGDTAALDALLSAIEAAPDPRSELIRHVSARCGDAHRIAILGVKGAGKSSLIVELARQARARGSRVGVVASERTAAAGKGARLGDRLRLDDLEFDEGVVVRAIAAEDGPRAQAIKTSFVADALDALGHSPVLLEILRLKGSDLHWLRRGHSVVLVLTPKGPDAQLLEQSGLLALCDLVVINKADKGGAEETEAALRARLPVQRLAGGEWEIPVLQTTAYRAEGIAEVDAALCRHLELMRSGGEFEARRRSQLALQLEQLVEDALLAKLYGDPSVLELLRDAAEDVAGHRLDLASAADRIARKLLESR